MSLGKSSLLFSLGTFISRILGLLREVILAAVFGATSLLDSFLVANRIPNMLRELAAEGALGSSFTKVFSELWEQDKNRAKSLIQNLILFLILILSFICLVGILCSPYLVKSLLLFDTGPEQTDFYQHTLGLTRILFPFIAFMSLGAVFSGALHQRGRFFLSSVAPIALNLGYITGALVLSYLLKLYGPLWIEVYFAPRELVGLALGVLLGGFFQMLILFLGVKQSFFKGTKFFSQKIKIFRNPDIKKVFILMWPMVIAASAGQFNVFVNTNFATSLEDGSVSYLSFAFRLLQLPIGIFAVAIGSASLPLFTKNLVQDKSYKSLNASLEKTIELTLWLLVPCMCFLLANSFEVIQVIFERGQFTETASYHTGNALFYYALGLLSYGFVKVLTSLYFALEKIKFAMRVSLFAIVTNFVLNFFLVSKYKTIGLALSTTCVMTISSCLLFWGLSKEKFIKFNFVRLTSMIRMILAASLVCSTLQLLNSKYFPILFFRNLLGEFFTRLSVLTLNGLFVVLCFAVFYSYHTKTNWLKVFKRKFKS